MKRITLLIITLLLAAISQPAAAAGPLRLAVTTSFAEPAVEIGRLFTRQNGIEVQSTVSSTGKLYAQIISGAPFDLLLAAEADRPQQLHGAGLAEEPVTYGIGRVVLWTAAPERCAATDWLTAFKTGDPRIAIPDPAVAPYGATVMAALKQAGLAEAVASRLVFAHNVGQAFQYGTVKACDLAFVALANALSEPGRTGCYWAVADAPPILHQACIIKNSPKLRVIYITAEDFVNEMIHALKNNRTEEFKNRFRRGCDVLLLEEVHFLGGKEKTQLELGYTLDALANDHKRIIFTSSLLPKDIPNFTRELSSRLTSGIVTTIEKPDYDTRIKILERKSFEQGIQLSDEIIALLGNGLMGDIRQIESALRYLKAKSELLDAEINGDLAREVILSHSSDQGCAAPEDIRSVVCQYFKVDPLALASKSRKKIHSYPRNVYIYLCRRLTAMTVEEIGKTLNRNHSTILYASEMIEHKMKVDNKVRNQIEFLSRKLKGVLK